jgi:hypothetical protein
LSASIAGTFDNGSSQFGFDRAVDLRTASFSVSQQIYGPLVLKQAPPTTLTLDRSMTAMFLLREAAAAIVRIGHVLQPL